MRGDDLLSGVNDEPIPSCSFLVGDRGGEVAASDPVWYFQCFTPTTQRGSLGRLVGEGGGGTKLPGVPRSRISLQVTVLSGYLHGKKRKLTHGLDFIALPGDTSK